MSPHLSLIERYLGSLYDTLDFGTHYQLHSSRAYLLAARTVKRRDAVSVQDYVRYMRGVLRTFGWNGASLRRRRPCFRAPRLLDTRWAPSGETVLFAEIEEALSGQRVTAAFGTVVEGGRHRVLWVTVAGAERDAARLRAQADHEMASVPPPIGPERVFLSLLELSYWRQHMPPEMPLFWLPEAAFSCHRTARCCSNHWAVRLSDNEVAATEARGLVRLLPRPPATLYRRVPEELLQEDEFRPFVLHPDSRGQCPFLTEENLCLVHQDAGRAVYHDCHVFPFGFTFTPDGVAVWTNLFCPSARHRKGRGFADNEADIRSRLQRVVPVLPQRFLRRADDPIPWPVFRAAEAQLLSILDREGHPVRQRLLAALGWLEAFTGAEPSPFDARLLERPLAPPLPEERQLADQVLGLLQRLRGLEPLPPPPGAARPAGGAADEAIGALPFVPYLLRTLVFSKYFSYPHGLVPGFNYVVLAYCLLVRRFGPWIPAAIPEAAWGEFFSALQHATYRRALAELSGHAVLRGLAQTPLFGELLLRVAIQPPAAPCHPAPEGTG
ncbi:MAG: hypothetical protein RMK29_11210 [Myxococcales bacterium]|nr:hypothetical protein [Myxococcota bacterium]MDW8282275.1 hypothetical protein [Myxococcales bacterium]